MHSLVAFTTTMLYFVPPSQGRRNHLMGGLNIGLSKWALLGNLRVLEAAPLILTYDASGTSVCFSSYFFHFLSVLGSFLEFL